MKILKQILAIAFREIKGLKVLFAASLVLGILPILVSQLSNMGLFLANKGDIGMYSSATTFLYEVVFSLIIGFKLFGHDLAERRLGFFFSKPISSGTLWLGKILGGITTAFGATLLTILPLLVFFPTEAVSVISDNTSVYMSLIPFSVAAGAIFGIQFRSKSIWLGIDIGLGLVSMLLVFFAIRHFVVLFAYRNVATSLIGEDAFISVSAIGVLLIASAAAIIYGRTDIKRAHSAISVTLWSTIFLSIFSFAAFGQWVVSAAPKDIIRLDPSISAVPQGSWFVISGSTWGRGNYHPNFLINSQTGKYVRVESEFSTSFSANGARAAWTIYNPGYTTGSDTVVVKTLNLLDPNAQETVFKQPFSTDGSFRIILSDDGSRLCVLNKNLITVFDTDSQKELGSGLISLNTNNFLNVSIQFMDSDRLRIYAIEGRIVGTESAKAIIDEFSISAKKMTNVAKIAIEAQGGFPLLSADKKRLILQENLYGKTYVFLYDADNGQLIAKLAEPKDNLQYTAKFLADNRVIVQVMDKGQNNTSLKLFSATGVEEKSISLNKYIAASVITEFASNQVLVATYEFINSVAQKKGLLVVDFNTATTTAKNEQLTPIFSDAINYYRWTGNAISINRKTVLMINEKGALVEYTPATNAINEVKLLKTN